MKKQLLPLLLSLLCAFILWSYVVIVVGPEYQDTFYDVNVDLESVRKALAEDEERKLMLLTESATIKLVLSGNRMDLNKLNANNIYVTVDPSKLTAGKLDYRVDIRYPDNVSSDAFTIESQSPARVTLEVVEWDEKAVDIKIDCINEAIIPEDYFIYEAGEKKETEKVKIKGPKEVLDQIAVARVNVELTEENKKTGIYNQEYKLTFYDAQNNPVDCSRVKFDEKEHEMITVSMPVHTSKTIPLKLYVIDGGCATATDNVKIEPATITVSGSDKALADFHELYLNTEGNALNLGAELVNRAWDVPITGIPEGIINRSNIETAKITLSFDNLETREFIIKTEDIDLTGLPEELTAEIAEQTIAVTLRGKKEKMAALGAAQISASVDFKGAGKGVNEWQVSISVVGTPSYVAVIDKNYTILVSIKDKPKMPEPASLNEPE